MKANLFVLGLLTSLFGTAQTHLTLSFENPEVDSVHIEYLHGSIEYLMSGKSIIVEGIPNGNRFSFDLDIIHPAELAYYVNGELFMFYRQVSPGDSLYITFDIDNDFKEVTGRGADQYRALDEIMMIRELYLYQSNFFHSKDQSELLSILRDYKAYMTDVIHGMNLTPDIEHFALNWIEADYRNSFMYKCYIKGLQGRFDNTEAFTTALELPLLNNELVYNPNYHDYVRCFVQTKMEHLRKATLESRHGKLGFYPQITIQDSIARLYLSNETLIIEQCILLHKQIESLAYYRTTPDSTIAYQNYFQNLKSMSAQWPTEYKEAIESFYASYQATIKEE